MRGFCSHILAERCSLETALLSRIYQGRIGDQDLLFEEPLRGASLHLTVLEVTKGSVPTRLPSIRMPLDLIPTQISSIRAVARWFNDKISSQQQPKPGRLARTESLAVFRRDLHAP